MLQVVLVTPQVPPSCYPHISCMVSKRYWCHLCHKSLWNHRCKVMLFLTFVADSRKHWMYCKDMRSYMCWFASCWGIFTSSRSFLRRLLPCQWITLCMSVHPFVQFSPLHFHLQHLSWVGFSVYNSHLFHGRGEQLIVLSRCLPYIKSRLQLKFSG